MKNTILVKVQRSFSKVRHTTVKYSPEILTGVGIVGLGATAYFAYKSAKKVEIITDDLENRRKIEEEIEALKDQIAQAARDGQDEKEVELKEQLSVMSKGFEPVSRPEVVRDLAGAVAKPVLTGGLSICAIALSYYIQHHRIMALAGAFASATLEREVFEKRFKEKYGEKQWEEFSEPTEEEQVVDKKGKEKTIKVKSKKDPSGLYGRWFDESSEYTADDLTYCAAFIDAQSTAMEDKMFRNGYIVLNDVLDKLGFERTRMGAFVGWDASQNFEIKRRTTTVTNPVTGEIETQIFVHWPKPKYVFDEIDYDGRYSE
jgi:DNA-binding protein YbaB